MSASVLNLLEYVVLAEVGEDIQLHKQRNWKGGFSSLFRYLWVPLWPDTKLDKWWFPADYLQCAIWNPVVKFPVSSWTLSSCFTHDDALPDTWVVWTTSVHFLQRLKMFIHFIMYNIRKLMVSVTVVFIRRSSSLRKLESPWWQTRVFPDSSFH